MDPKRSALYEALRAGLSGEEQLTDEMIYERIDRVLYAEGKRQRLTNEEKLKYRTILFSAVRELDILSYIMRDEDVTEIMVNGPDSIYVEKNGVIEAYPEGFTTEAMLPDVIQKIASSVNRRVNEATPMVDARLPDGSRVNVALPPVSLNGPVVTIRRFPKEPMSMEALVRIGSISREAAEYLRTLVECGYNIFISGVTGAGKTTFLGALAEYIPVNERVVTIEDSAELRLRKVRNLIRLESRPATLEGEYEVTIRDLIRNALRMRPDRVIVGEIRSGEALDMLSAMNTGHDGSLSTGHANSAADMLSRIETMVLMGMDLPLSAVRAQIASGIDILVHLGRLRDRSRRVLGIYEVLGVSEGEVKIEALFEFREEGTYAGRIEGRLIRTAHTLRRTEKLKQRAGRL